ncbi:hypothetical protein HELRODRAFT_159297 [Helobdella robusta]|uniref:Glucose-methanol-choline oxidoreductase N-terminal domain-containing protein n=1 Tax=Helobdella robusta TaxID=6412 RepID=T1ENU8_HELRO|nr:hypothetical protein HELRODRAFT_159297 [Helobdella robusta]ESO12711.1 hypothetical protein HELRODRAFT_159297 [Helobdella robusta]
MSENENVKVLLLEAGSEHHSKNVLDIPAMSSEHHGTFMDWNYKIEPQKYACKSFINNQINWPQGRMLGGTDGFNHMIYIRGNPRDYDEWALNGCSGWSYEDVLPYFIKAENNKNMYYKQSDYHGSQGPLSVSDMSSTLLSEKFIMAAKEMKYDRLDVNGPKQLGVSLIQGLTSWGKREGVLNAYLYPSMNRDNLHVATHAYVRKVLFKGNQAVGIELFWNKTIRQVRAIKEVILSAGVIGSPHILMLSGIGPQKHLKKFDIPVIMDLPVGRNLQDHVTVLGLEFTIKNKIATTDKKTKSLSVLFDYLIFGKGVLTTSGYEATGFFTSAIQPSNITYPFIQVHLFNSMLGTVMSEERLTAIKSRLNMNNKVFTSLFGDMMYNEGFTLYPILLHPRSRGSVTLNSSNPYDKPIIDPNYLSEDQDVQILLEGIRLSERIVSTKEMKTIGAERSSRRHPFCEQHEDGSDEYWSCFIRHNTMSMHHGVGTCKMGAAGDIGAVVDDQLRVRGVKKLRVVDASVIPNIISGDINAAVIMIAEKAADLILNRKTVKKFGEKETHDEWHERIHKKDEL